MTPFNTTTRKEEKQTKQKAFPSSKGLLDYVDREYKLRWTSRTEYIRTMEQQANFYKMERRALEYAKSFYKNISISDIVLDSTDYLLPIYFTSRGEVIEEDPDNETLSEGRLAIDPINPKKFCIRIALPWPSYQYNRTLLPKHLKQTIRHELLHYYLYIHDLPFTDDTALFHAYCYLFDAGAYAPLNEEEQTKYNRFLDALKEVGEDTPPFVLVLLANAIIAEDENAKTAFDFHMNAHKQLQEQVQKQKQQAP